MYVLAVLTRNVSSSGRRPGRRNRGQMHDHVGAPQGLDRLAVVGQIRHELVAVERSRPHQIDAQHIQAVRGELRDDRAAGLAGTARDDDARQSSGRTVRNHVLPIIRRAPCPPNRRCFRIGAGPVAVQKRAVQQTRAGNAERSSARRMSSDSVDDRARAATRRRDAGCGKKKAAATTTTPPAATTTTRAAGPAAVAERRPRHRRPRHRRRQRASKPSFDSIKNCTQLVSLGKKVSKRPSRRRPAWQQGRRFTKEVELFKALADASPSDIRGDFETLATRSPPRPRRFRRRTSRPARRPLPRSWRSSRAAGKAFSAPKVAGSREHLEAWAADELPPASQ